MAEKRSVLEGGELFPRPVLGHSEVCYCHKLDEHYTMHSFPYIKNAVDSRSLQFMLMKHSYIVTEIYL